MVAEHFGKAADAAIAGDDIPGDAYVIEVRVAELSQLFNVIDPSPFRDKDLDPNAEEFIVGWSQTAPRDATLALRVYVEQGADPGARAEVLRDAVHTFFNVRAQAARRRLRQLFHRGRISLAIGLAFLAVFIVAGDLVARQGTHIAQILHEGFLIGGWVAMWRPIEVFLYDWWPILADARLFDRLASMPVQLRYRADHARSAPADEGYDSDAALDAALEDTFPASDPISNQNPSTVTICTPRSRRAATPGT